MKKIIVLIAICFFSVVNFNSMAQMIKIEPSPQVIDIKMIKEMYKIINQMNKVLQKMVEIMDEDTIIDKDSQKEIYEIMEKMSENMHDLSIQIKNGQMDSNIKQKLQSRLKSINKSAEKLNKRGKKRK